MRRVLNWCWMIGIVGACSFGGSDKGSEHGKEEDSETESFDAVTVVEIREVGPGDVSDMLVTSAVVESEAQADLYPNTTGVVVSIHRDEGDGVQVHDLLAVLENVTLDAGAERARSDLERLEAQYREMVDLQEQGAVSDREVLDLRYALETARTTWEEAKGNLGHTRLTAPFDGVVAARDVRVGELAGTGARAFQVVDMNRLRVVANLPERDVGRVRLGQAATLISAYDDNIRAPGVVSRIAPVVDSASGTFRVTIELTPGEGELRPGQFVTVELEVDRHEGVLVVPRSAVVYEDGDPVVYRMIPEPPPVEEESDEEDEEKSGELQPWSWWPFGEDGLFSTSEAPAPDEAASESSKEPTMIAERVRLELGLADQDLFEVNAGLVSGDQVITVGHLNLNDGASVRLPRDDDDEAAEAGVEDPTGEVDEKG